MTAFVVSEDLLLLILNRFCDFQICSQNLGHVVAQSQKSFPWSAFRFVQCILHLSEEVRQKFCVHFVDCCDGTDEYDSGKNCENTCR